MKRNWSVRSSVSCGYPVQLWGNNLPIEKADAYLQSYCCSVARSVMELEMREISHMVKAYAFTSLCDTLINLREIYRRVFSKPTLELSIPITQTEVARHNYLESVVKSVTAGLEKITGNHVTPESLGKAAKLYGRRRALQRRLYRMRSKNPGLVKSFDFYTAIKTGFFLPGDVYNRMLEDLLQKLEGMEAHNGSRPKLLISGMVFDPLEIHKIIDELGAWVVDDDFANGWRTVSKADLKTENLVEGITDYLLTRHRAAAFTIRKMTAIPICSIESRNPGPTEFCSGTLNSVSRMPSTAPSSCNISKMRISPSLLSTWN